MTFQRRTTLFLTDNWLKSKGVQNAHRAEIESYVIGGIKQDIKEDAFDGFNSDANIVSMRCLGCFQTNIDNDYSSFVLALRKENPLSYLI